MQNDPKGDLLCHIKKAYPNHGEDARTSAVAVKSWGRKLVTLMNPGKELGEKISIGL